MTDPDIQAASDDITNGLKTPARSEHRSAEAPHWREIETVRLINVLRADEGDSVTILCDNPDFNDQPNSAIVCNGDWTGWVDKRFAADTVLDALSMAFVEKQLPSPRKVIAVSNGHHWVERFSLVCCRDCGFVRRADDQNAPCKGRVGIGIRRDLLPASFTSDLAAAEAKVKELEEVMGRIAKQATSEEMRRVIAEERARYPDASQWHASANLADFEGGYNECVNLARSAIKGDGK